MESDCNKYCPKCIARMKEINEIKKLNRKKIADSKKKERGDKILELDNNKNLRKCSLCPNWKELNNFTLNDDGTYSKMCNECHERDKIYYKNKLMKK